ncbi:type VI secretion system-associated FHA domain protein TagH [Erwinia sorbitola]|uniref:Type VI secretion system-associated FHA domain protein TagH n=1 Tax=Erwinia sorbitola TaxID=2681984 RepID=A0ABW9R8S1_9GAMM|nr:type VI secretion system-associated FHA domain protein TagH [Erwinia sorbitola]MTD26533.1 type VI secretion system-associated FHA domain protein TagH [Erwinia sorbitola]
MEKQQPSLLLRVVNGDKLESGKQARCRFQPSGGSIGSDASNHWSIQDQGGNILPTQFVIEWRDGYFCLRLTSGSITINLSELTTNSGYVRVQQGDEITLGDLLIKSDISHSALEVNDALMASPESLVSSFHNPLEAMLEGGSSRASHGKTENQLAETVENGSSHDPLHALQNETLTSRQPDSASDSSQSLHQDHSFTPLFSAPLSDVASSSGMVQDFIDLPQIKPSANRHDLPDGDMEPQHIAITPLMRGMSARIPISNSQEASDFLEEAGKTLRAAIEGLLAIQHSQHGLRDKHLRPIEDNPLRLNMDYGTTLSLLFAEQKSPVHLAAPAAVAESLHNLRLHHQANQQAIARALSTMLDAFSPDSLLSRFKQYQRSNQRQEPDAAWAWKMYQNYYQELASSRQQGFEKLFGEVYEQAYDQALRQGIKDSER